MQASLIKNMSATVWFGLDNAIEPWRVTWEPAIDHRSRKDVTT